MSTPLIRPVEHHHRNLRAHVEQALSAAIVSGDLCAGHARVRAHPGRPVRRVGDARARGDAEPREARLRRSRAQQGVPGHGGQRGELRQIVGVRRLLEPEAMQQLAGRFPPNELPELRERWPRRSSPARSAGDLRSYLEADQRFHLRLAALLGNPLLVEVVADLRSRTRLVGLAAWSSRPSWRRSAAEHIELLDALASGDGDGARAPDAPPHRSRARLVGRCTPRHTEPNGAHDHAHRCAGAPGTPLRAPDDRRAANSGLQL